MGRDSSDLWAAALNKLREEDRKLVAFDGQHKLDVLSDLGQLVIKVRENSIEKRWRFHRPSDGQTVILRDLFSKIVVWIDRFKEIGDIVVQYDPVHAALPWAGVRFLLQLAVSDINKFAFTVEGAETIARSISRYATLEQIYLRYDTTATRAVKGLEGALVRLYAAILIYLAKTKRYFEEPAPKRIVKAAVTSQRHFEDLLRNIDNELVNVDRYAGLVDAERSKDITKMLMSLSIHQHEMHVKLRELLQSIDSPICRINHQLDGLEDQLNQSQRVEILRWLSSQPYLEHHRQVKKQALPGSGQWLLQDPLYIEWYKQSVSSLLWLHGKPGSGKSTLVSLVIEDMIKRFEAGQSALPVYFYCARSAAEPERSKPGAVLASILRQISCVQPNAPLFGPVIEKYKRQGEGFKSNGLDLDDSRDLIIRLSEDYSMTTIIVDALDECDPEMRQSLLDAFEHILKESVGLVKIFVSSRDDQDIVHTLRDYPNLDISSDKNTADIEAYVRMETHKLVKTGQLLRNSRRKEEMTASIVDRVSSGAHGIFRWASLQFEVLRVLKRDEDVRAQLGRLPPKLEQLYLEVYNNLISNQGEIGRSVIDNALKWLLCPQELNSSEFLVAVAANLKNYDGDISVDGLLELCNNFVVYDEGLDVFRFAHLSVREFLEKKSEFVESSCYSLAAECCLLQILASSNCPSAEHLISDEHLLRLREGLTCTEPSPCAGFLEYSNCFWMVYCGLISQSNRSDDTNFGRIFHFFFSDKLGSNSPLNAWVQWYCSRVLDEDDSASRFKLQNLLTNCSDSLSRSFLVAACFGFSEIVTFCVRNRGLGDETKDNGLILAVMAGQHESLDIFIEDIESWTITEPLLFYAVRALDKEKLALLLERVPQTMFTHRIVAAVVEDWDDGKMTVLLDKYPELTVTERLLELAVEYASQDNFRVLVARIAKPLITDHMLAIPRRWRPEGAKPLVAYLEKMWILLDKAGESGLIPRLIESAAAHSDDCVIEETLRKCLAGNITAGAMVEAAQRGPKIFSLMLKYGGKVTDTALDEAAVMCDAQAWRMLLEQGCEFSINANMLKRAALYSPYVDEVLSLLLDHVDDMTLANEMAGLIHEVARLGSNTKRMRQLLDHAKDVKISQDMLLAAILNPYPDRLGRVTMFLERSSELRITEDMLMGAAGDEDWGFELVKLFLEQEGEAEISEQVLMAAACNYHQGCQIMQLLLEENSAAELTGDVLMCAAQKSSVELVLELLDRSKTEVVTGRLLEAAAANLSCGGELVKLLLARAEITEFPEDVFVVAIGNEYNGTEVILTLEENLGRIKMTDSLLAKCVHRATEQTIDLLLSRTDPAHFTKEFLISAMSNNSIYSHRVHCAVVEKSLHIPVTADVLQSAVKYGSANLFRFLWNRYPGSLVPQDLINAASKNIEIFEFLLHEADCIEIGEETIKAIVAHRHLCHQCFNVLQQRGLQADTSEGVPGTILMNGGIKVKCLSSSPLQLSNGMRITEDMFRIAASCGHEKPIQSLSAFCKMESIPGKWLDVTRLHDAAERADEDLLKTLLGRGVDPDVSSPDGVTPLVRAARVNKQVAVHMLLSAGASPDGGPMLQWTPLCVASARGHYDMVKILVNAGASVSFRDSRGMTPAMIAKDSMHMKIFRYLEQCRIEQEGGGRETPKST